MAKQNQARRGWRAAKRKPAGADHAVPVFEGRESKRHERLSYKQLRQRARQQRNRAPDARKLETIVQFAGFPRSGHSVVGSLIDAHPRAVISHELDMTGLIEAGFSQAELLALIQDNSATFEANGRFWNGHCYRVAGGWGGGAERPKVVGDKKGDWAVRRLAENAGMLSTADAVFTHKRQAWIAVVRNPFDNIATLSLRKGRHYDALRIAAADASDFKTRLGAATDEVAQQVLPEMVDDYATLLAGVAALKARVAPENWLELRHEDLIARPKAEMARVFEFLGLFPKKALLAATARVVAAEVNRSRYDIAWGRADVDRVEALVESNELLSGYAFADNGARPPVVDADDSPGRGAGAAAVSRAAEHPVATAGRRVERVRLLSCVGLDFDSALLPHFLDHYRALGVAPARMHVVLHQHERDERALAAARSELQARGAPEPEVWVGAYTSAAMWQRRRAMQARYCEPQDWVLNADIDEFHVYPAELESVLAWLEENACDVLDGPLIDRLAHDGALAPVEPAATLGDQFPIVADAMCPLGKRHGERDATGTVKLMLFRASVEPGLGGHRPAAGAKYAYGQSLADFPRIKDASFRFRLPTRVDHFKWHSAVAESVERRRATTGASAAGSRYGSRILEHLQATDGRIDLASVVVKHERDGAPAEWREALGEYRQQAQTLRQGRHRAQTHREAEPAPPEAFGPWRVRRLTDGTQDARFHAHSYYDIPVFHERARRIVGYQSYFAERWMTADDAVAIGLVDLDDGGFRAVGRSVAWSWQQGPMAQFHPDGYRVFWNDRDDDTFVAREFDTESGQTRTLPMPVYAVDSNGAFTLGVNMARLNHARPGYGYAGGAGADLETRASDGDGIWRTELETGAARLVLSLARARAALIAFLSPDEARAHERADERIYWFNHVKLSPAGARFTAKFRWRDRGPKPHWDGTMGVSVTCGADGRDLRVLARGTSHVMWLDETRLYCWHQAEKNLGLFEDTAPVGKKAQVLMPETITRNVHIRHVPAAPDVWILDTPYQERVKIATLDVPSGAFRDVAAFSNHVPKHGAFRCDLHPVPSRDGRRVVVTSLHDGGRQVYVIEHESLFA